MSITYLIFIRIELISLYFMIPQLERKNTTSSVLCNVCVLMWGRERVLGCVSSPLLCQWCGFMAQLLTAWAPPLHSVCHNESCFPIGAPAASLAPFEERPFTTSVFLCSTVTVCGLWSLRLRVICWKYGSELGEDELSLNFCLIILFVVFCPCRVEEKMPAFTQILVGLYR